MQEQTENVETLPDPVLPDDAVDDEAPEDPSPRKRRRPRNGPPNPKNLDYEEWIQTFDWEQPGMKSVLKRVSPAFQAGYLFERENGAPDLEEIKQLCGGGRYECAVRGPSEPGGPARLQGRKLFSISGPAKAAGEQKRNPSGGPAGDDTIQNYAAPAQAGMVGLLSKTFDHFRQEAAEARKGSGGSGGNGSEIRSAYSESAATMRASADAQVAAVREAAEQRVNMYARQIEDLRRQHDADRKRWEEQMNETREKADLAGSHADKLVTLIHDGSNKQVQEIVRSFEQRETARQQQAAKEIEAIHRQNQILLESQKQQYENQVTLLRATYEGQINLLTVQLTNLQHKLDLAESSAQKLRDSLMQIYQERDPKKQLSEMQSIMSFAQELTGKGGGADIDEDAPAYMKLLSSYAPTINSIAGALGQKMGVAPQQMPPQPMQAPPAAVQTPHGMVQPPVQRPQQLPPQQRPVARPQQPQPQRAAAPPQPQPAAPPRPREQFSRKDLEEAVDMLETAYDGGVQPANAAGAAWMNGDRRLLASIARRPQGKVINELRRAGVIKDSSQLARPEGVEYMTTFLQELQKLVDPPKEG